MSQHSLRMPAIVLFLTMLVFVAGCGNADEKTVSKAMDELEGVMTRFNETGEEDVLVRDWAAINVTSTPADFQIAWREAHDAWKSIALNPPKRNEGESTFDYMGRFLKEPEGKLDNLGIIAAKYVPEIQQRRAKRAAVLKEANEYLEKMDEQ